MQVDYNTYTYQIARIINQNQAQTLAARSTISHYNWAATDTAIMFYPI